MDSKGVDIHVLSPYSGFYNYDHDLAVAVATSRDSNDEIHQMTKTWPDRFGGILEKCPDLKVCIAHGGGSACFGMGRMDRGWQVRSEARTHISHPPSTYQRRMYYDCVTMSETALRFLIDTVGAGRVVLGSDWPFVRWHPSPVG